MARINEIIKGIMNESKLTELEFAQMVGYSQSHVSKFVNFMVPSKKVMLKIYAAFPDYRLPLVKAYLESCLDKVAEELVQEIGEVESLDQIKDEVMTELQARHIVDMENQPLYTLVDKAIEKDSQAQKYIGKMLEGLAGI